MSTAPHAVGGLRVLVLDDEAPALDELAWLLRRDPRIAEVHATDSPTEALRMLKEREIDAVFLDIQMPGLDGIELASVLARFKRPPAVVFVTAHEEHAVDAFELDAVDYVLKPVRDDRIAEAVRRVLGGARPESGSDQVAVERSGVTRFIPVADIRYVEAEGDYARLHTATDSHLVRIPLTQLEQQWSASGFVRIHRSLLVAIPYIEELRVDAGRCTVVVGGVGGRVELAVSRRLARQLRDLLVRDVRRSEP
jgi:DNA-binding LytR/AlgR family response regulator